MITPAYTERMILWLRIERMSEFTPFLCMGDHGPYCRIEYDGGRHV